MKKTLITFTIMLTLLSIEKRTVENVFMPGYSTNELEDLNPHFKKKVKKLITTMEKKGHSVKISDTYRSQERQDFIFKASSVLSGIKGGSRGVTGTVNSKHSITKNGEPSSCAVDIRPQKNMSIKDQAEFYTVLRDEAVKIGLRSGANFKKRKSSPFYEYGLGYDPGHVEIYCKR